MSMYAPAAYSRTVNGGDVVPPPFDPKNMPFRRLGNSGLRVPLFSFGGWLTIGGTVQGDLVKELMATAYDAGINMFDTAEGYSEGNSEREIGRVIQEMGWKRSDLIITTKIFFGDGSSKEPNSKGLSRKHIIEGLNESLRRLRMDYVDIVYAHRPDRNVSMEEVVRAFNYVIDKGSAYYWGTSEWSLQEIDEAHQVAHRLGLVGPVVEQCQYNLMHRARPEVEYGSLYAKYGMGAAVYSPLALGVLTGKYNKVVENESRFSKYHNYFWDTVETMHREGDQRVSKINELEEYARDKLSCSVTHLSLAWLAAQSLTSTIILGASKPEQILDNIAALAIIPKITPEVHRDITTIMSFWNPNLAPRYRDDPMPNGHVVSSS